MTRTASLPIPGRAPAPEPYQAGVDAVFAHLVQHRGERDKRVWRREGDSRVLTVDRVTFIPDKACTKLDPDSGQFASFVGVKFIGGFFGLCLVVTPLLPSSVTSSISRMGIGGLLGVAAAVIGLFVAALLRDNRRVAAMEARGIWVDGLFLFPAALLIARPRSMEVILKSTIRKFVYQLKTGSNQRRRTYCKHGPEGDESMLEIANHDLAVFLEAWRTAE